MQDLYNSRPRRRRREFVAPSEVSHASYYNVDTPAAADARSLLPKRTSTMQRRDDNFGVVGFIKGNVILVAVLGLVVLVGVGFAVYWFFIRKTKVEPEPVVQPPAPPPSVPPFHWTQPEPARQPDPPQQSKPVKRKRRRRKRAEQEPEPPVQVEPEPEYSDEESEESDYSSDSSVSDGGDDGVESTKYPQVEIPPVIAEGLRQLRNNNHDSKRYQKTNKPQPAQPQSNRPSARAKGRKKRGPPGARELAKALNSPPAPAVAVEEVHDSATG